MKETISVLSFFLALFFHSAGQVNVLLDIPGRLQWDNDNGYCGETSVQMAALFYGNYISQDVCRTVAGGELLIAENDAATLDAFSFQYDEWDYNQPTPQYQNYLVWVKQHLNNRHPVIITVFVQGMDDPDYDHIIPAIGCNASNANTYNGTDQLMFNDCYDSLYFTRSFASIWDTRSMNGNGALYEYCIPKDVDYGIALTGIRDAQHITRPVHLAVDSWDEPNVTLGELPKLLHAVIRIDSLTTGNKYALLRYNNYQNVPSSNFNPVSADTKIYFTAAGSVATFTDSFLSNAAVFYRCIPYNFNNIDETTANANYQVSVYPNPAKNEITIELLQRVNGRGTTCEILNPASGQILRKLSFKEQKTIIDISEFTSGFYIMKIRSEHGMAVKKLVIE